MEIGRRSGIAGTGEADFARRARRSVAAVLKRVAVCGKRDVHAGGLAVLRLAAEAIAPGPALRQRRTPRRALERARAGVHAELVCAVLASGAAAVDAEVPLLLAAALSLARPPGPRSRSSKQRRERPGSPSDHQAACEKVEATVVHQEPSTALVQPVTKVIGNLPASCLRWRRVSTRRGDKVRTQVAGRGHRETASDPSASATRSSKPPQTGSGTPVTRPKVTRVW